MSTSEGSSPCRCWMGLLADQISRKDRLSSGAAEGRRLERRVSRLVATEKENNG